MYLKIKMSDRFWYAKLKRTIETMLKRLLSKRPVLYGIIEFTEGDIILLSKRDYLKRW